MQRVLERSVYRSRQLLRSIRPRVDGELKGAAFDLLTGPQQALFESMVPRDQQHCLEVFQTLESKGHRGNDLLVAALLHDCGKGRIALWHRVAFVLLEAAAPAWLDRVCVPGDGAGWRHAMYRCRSHPALGAELASQAGCSEVTIALIRDDATSDRLREPLAALHAADDAV